MKCPNSACGRDNPEGSAFCSFCGTKLEVKHLCPSCGMEVPEGARFCMHCGSSLDGAEPAPAGSGISIGSRNVVAGDIIGRKDDYHISGNATIYHSEDDTKRVSPCSICGRHTLVSEGFTCPHCGRFVCQSCYDSSHGMCTDCLRKENEKAENGYLSYLESSISGPIGRLQKSALIREGEKRGINPDHASSMIAGVLKKLGFREISDILSSVDRDLLDKAERLYFSGEEGSVEESYALIGPLFGRHITDGDVADLYLRILRDADRITYDKLIENAGSQSPSVISMRIEDLSDAGKLPEAEDMLREAMILFPENGIIKAAAVKLCIRIGRSLGRDKYLFQARSIAEELDDSGTPLDRSRKLQARVLAGIFPDFGLDRDTLLSRGLYPRLCSAPSAIYAGSGPIDVHSISEACRAALPGSRIVLRDGQYIEALSFDKDLEIVSLAVHEGRSPEDGMPIIIPEAGFRISGSLRMEGIMLTSDASLGYESAIQLLENAECPDSREYPSPDDPFVVLEGKAEFHNCLIASVPHTAILSAAGSSLIFADSSIASAGNCGIYAEKGSELKIKGGRISGCGSAGIHTETDGEINGLHVSGCADGIVIREAAGSYTDCRAESNLYAGFLLEENSRAELRGCIAAGNPGMGYCFDSSSPSLSSCISKGNQAGFGIRSGSSAIIEDSASSMESNGFFISGNSSCTLRRCTASMDTRGFQVYDSAEGVFESCVAENCRDYGFQADGEASAEYAGCRAAGNRRAGFFTKGESTCRCTGCTADGNGFGFGAAGSSKPSFEECSAVRNKNSGFICQDEAEAVIRKCSSDENDCGFVVGKSSSAEISTSSAERNVTAGFVWKDDGGGEASYCSSDGNGYGYYSADSSKPRMEVCRAEENSRCGFFFCGSSEAHCTGCLSENDSYGFAFKGEAKPYLGMCNASSSRKDGFLIADDAAGKAEACKVFEADDYGYRIMENAAPELSGCYAMKSGLDGFIFEKNASGKCRKCASGYNSGSGFVCSGESSPELRDCGAVKNKENGFVLREETSASIDGGKAIENAEYGYADLRGSASAFSSSNTAEKNGKADFMPGRKQGE